MKPAVSNALYGEEPLKTWVRTRFASRESREGLSKKSCRRERYILRGCCAVATFSFLAALVVSPIWTQVLGMVHGIVWCGLAGLIETASDWQRDSDVAALKRAGLPTEEDLARAKRMGEKSIALKDEVDE